MSETGDRSSISTLWSKSKQVFKGKPPSASESPGSRTSESDQSKHQTRRAQVRSAQIRHRQRKANYQKELELELSQYRELIFRGEAEAAALRVENDAIKAKLSEVGVYLRGTPGSRESSVPVQLTTPEGRELEVSGTTPELFGNVDVDELTATLGMDGVMGTPAFAVSSSSSGGSLLSGSSPAGSDPGTWLSRAQEYTAINFILSLEHICWDHFTLGDFPRHNYADPPDPKPVCSDPDHGHTLMATSYVMQTAPSTFYDARAALREHQKYPASSPSPPTFEWQTPAISLATLRGLASSLNPGDKELTPVQAWFELAERYGTDKMVHERTLEFLRREFKGVVKCVAYGAAMERGAFESVAGRVLGSFI